LCVIVCIGEKRVWVFVFDSDRLVVSFLSDIMQLARTPWAKKFQKSIDPVLYFSFRRRNTTRNLLECAESE
jgi:hypothetical protein